jgi:hypothetical protein
MKHESHHNAPITSSDRKRCKFIKVKALDAKYTNRSARFESPERDHATVQNMTEQGE